MKNQPRRKFIKNVSVIGAALTISPLLKASGEQILSDEGVGAEFPDSNKTRVTNQRTTSLANEYMPAFSTALVVVDTYNDFLSSEGLTWPLLNLVINEFGVVGNIESTIQACRNAGVLIAFAPHHRYRGENDFSSRKYLHLSQVGQLESKVFSAGEFGGDFYQNLGPTNGDVLASEHTCSSGFADTNLDEQLRKKNITHLVLIGCISNTCVEATARSAVDLGYYVTVVTDAIAAFSPADHRTAVDINYPLVLNNTVTTSEFLVDLRSAESTTIAS